jgi:hypothetical protein
LGKVLVADHFVAVDLLDPGAVLAALVEQLDELAGRLGCTAVRSLVHGGTPDPAESLDAAGHRREDSMLLLKRLGTVSRGPGAGQGGFSAGSAAATG